MYKKLIQMLNGEKGFTLVELMVVVAIIGILVAIAVPIFGEVTDSAERSAAEGNLRTIDGAIMMYRAQEGQFPEGTWNVGNNGFDDSDLDSVDGYIEDFDPAGGEVYRLYKSNDRKVKGAFYIPSDASVGGMDGNSGPHTLPIDWE